MLRPVLFCLAVAAAAPAHAASLTVQVDGVRSTEGRVGCALFSGASGFPGKYRSAKTQVLKASPGRTTCVFEDVKPGTYAVSVMHDANGNGRLDTNLLGIPKEDWGVSNNPGQAIRAPRFAEAAFRVAGDKATVIRVKVAPFSMTGK